MRAGLVKILILSVFIAAFYSFCVQAEAPRPGRAHKTITADHSQFKALQGPFKNGEEITAACASCHNQAENQVKKTPHWEWHVAGDNARGKGGLIVNNYCVSANEAHDKSCMDCHVGWNATESSVNCLNCHSGQVMNWVDAFNDLAAMAGDSDESTREIVQDLQEQIRQSVISVGTPSNKNCGSCHFYGGGGDRVKRGDMGSDLLTASRDLDVHMSKQGAGLLCVDCHNTRNHQVPGRKYNVSAQQERENLGEPDFKSFLRCEACHTEAPHKDAVLNDHFKTISCQTCHIPMLARNKPTKTWWDWSKAGQMKDGKPFDLKDEFHEKSYLSAKGEFRWEKNVLPEYAWFDGAMENRLLNQEIDPSKVNDLQWPNVAPHAPGAKIHPFKVHRGKQPYDTELKRLLAPMLSGPEGYWKNFDWQRSLAAGQQSMGLPYSGKFDFVETRFMYPANHTVAPKEQALRCDDCHHRVGDGQGSRMAGVSGVYVAGRGDLIWLTRIAWLFMGLTFLGVLGHAAARIVLKIRRGE